MKKEKDYDIQGVEEDVVYVERIKLLEMKDKEGRRLRDAKSLVV